MGVPSMTKEILDARDFKLQSCILGSWYGPHGDKADSSVHKLKSFINTTYFPTLTLFSIYDKRDDFNFHITNFPFLSSNIPSSPAYGVLSLNLYDTPGLAPRMNVLFWGPGDFPVSYSNRDTLWNAWNRHSGNFMVVTGILLSNME